MRPRVLLPWILLNPLIGFGAQASDSENEGAFLNRGAQVLYCFGDQSDPVSGQRKICRTAIRPGETCRGDAIASEETGTVYRIPTATRYLCEGRGAEIRCDSEGTWSDSVAFVAGLARGGGYGILTWDEFRRAITGSQFGESPIVACPLRPVDHVSFSACTAVQEQAQPLPTTVYRPYTRMPLY